MIILRSPKGWTGPKEVDGVPIEGTFRAHQVPLANVSRESSTPELLEAWMKSYQPEKLFDATGGSSPSWQDLAPEGHRRMGASPHVNGGRVLNALALPDFVDYALEVPAPGKVIAEAPRKLGEFLRDVIKINPNNFRLFCPDETNSNRLNAVFEATDRCSSEPTVPIDDHVSPDGRVMEVLSEHCCEGWLEGYLLTGRHGVLVVVRGICAGGRFDADAACEVAGAVRRNFHGANRSLRSTFSSPAIAGATITMASAIRRPDSSTTRSHGAAKSSASTIRRMRTAC